MEKNLQSLLTQSEIIFGSSDSSVSRAIRHLVKQHKLKKIAPRLYTSNLKDSPENIIQKNLYQILNEYFPGGLLSHRTALEGGPSKEGIIVITYRYTRKIKLPGKTIYLIEGKKAQPSDSPFLGNLFLASRERALLENLQPSRLREGIKKTLSQEYIERYLEKLSQVYGPEELNRIRDNARKIAKTLALTKEFQRLEKMLSALLGTHQPKFLKTEEAKARATGKPYDTKRIELFANLILRLQQNIIDPKRISNLSGKKLKNFAFFESYFSNYIEGTQFEIAEAAEIIFQGKLIPSRSEDSHDILGTFRIVSDKHEMQTIPKTPDQLIELLQRRHAILMAGRPDKNPGQFKFEINRAGRTIFVNPELVRGTLIKAFELYQSLRPGILRAIFMMFLVSEIHPFVDGNGRIARIMMNAELDYAKEGRIIIPTVYREDYLLSLRRLSREWDSDAYIAMLLRAQLFTQNIDFSNYETCLRQLEKCQAFLEPSEGKLLINHR